jgi:hypothetical protein
MKNKIFVPGPGTYKLKGIGDPKKGPTLKGRLATHLRSDSPGPGQYRLNSTISARSTNLNTSQERPDNFVLKHKVSPAQFYSKHQDWTETVKNKITFGKKLSGNSEFDRNPGPGTYEPLEALKQVNKVVCTKISSCPRNELFKNRQSLEIPGPGAYEGRLPTTPSAITLKGRITERRKTDFSPGPGSYHSNERSGDKYIRTKIFKGMSRTSTNWVLPGSGPSAYYADQDTKGISKTNNGRKWATG